MLFPVVRLVFFLVSDESDVAVRKEAQEANLTAVLTGVLDSAVHYEWPSNQLVAHECLKVSFIRDSLQFVSPEKNDDELFREIVIFRT